MSGESFTIRAIYEGGVLKPSEPLDLPEGSEVVLVVRRLDAVTADDDPSGWQTMRKIIGMWRDAPPGEPIARDHDRYLYGEGCGPGPAGAGSSGSPTEAPTGSLPDREADDDPTGWKTARRVIGMWKDAPADDLAEAHDDYLYGPGK